VRYKDEGGVNKNGDTHFEWPGS